MSKIIEKEAKEADTSSQALSSCWCWWERPWLPHLKSSLTFFYSSLWSPFYFLHLIGNERWTRIHWKTEAKEGGTRGPEPVLEGQARVLAASFTHLWNGNQCCPLLLPPPAPRSQFQEWAFPEQERPFGIRLLRTLTLSKLGEWWQLVRGALPHLTSPRPCSLSLLLSHDSSDTKWQFVIREPKFKISHFDQPGSSYSYWKEGSPGTQNDEKPQLIWA